jgi:dipeptidase E
MKLVFYSGYDKDNAAIDREVIRIIGKKNPRVVFIPSTSHAHDFEFDYVRETFASYGVKKMALFNIDHPYSTPDAELIFKTADMIYLSGGNTFYFLKSILRNHLDRLLLEFVLRGGVLVGLSAGAIVMTPSIATASYPKFDRDENTVGISNFEAMGLVDFEFFPHFTPEPEYSSELQKQSKLIKHPLYGVSDGGGIVVENGRLSFFGDVWAYVDGHMFKINSASIQAKKKIKKKIAQKKQAKAKQTSQKNPAKKATPKVGPATKQTQSGHLKKWSR